MYIQENYIVHNNTAILDHVNVWNQAQIAKVSSSFVLIKQLTLWHKYEHSIQALVMGKTVLKPQFQGS